MSLTSNKTARRRVPSKSQGRRASPGEEDDTCSGSREHACGSMPHMVDGLHLKIPKRCMSAKEILFLTESLNVILDLFSIHGFIRDGYSTKRTLKHWTILASYSTPMKFVKYKIAAFFSSWTNTDVPECPGFPPEWDSPRSILGGRAYRWCLLQQQQHPEIFMQFLTGVLYSKKGMPRPDADDLREAEDKAFSTMTTPMQQQKSFWLRDWVSEGEVRMDGSVSIETVKSQLRRTVREIFSGCAKDVDFDGASARPKPFFPSTSSDHSFTRARGGALGHLFESGLLGAKIDESVPSGIEFGLEQGRPVVDMSLLETRFWQFYRKCWEAALVEKPLVTPVALAEALKVRVISKGPSFLYTVLKPLQKFLWRRMQNFRCFKLTGQEVTAEFVQKVLGKRLATLQKFLSVDYTAATDNLHSWVSEEVVKAISEECEFSPELQMLFQRSLTGHIYESRDGRQAPQARGQLMGSVTSFPILCIANAAICRWTIELDTDHTYSLNDAPLAVNGDDAVMKVTSNGRYYWEKISSFCGLEPSVGKVYFTDKFLNINSTTYMYDSNGITFDEVDCSVFQDGVLTEKSFTKIGYFSQVKYVNLGLLNGMGRSVSTSKEGEKQDRLRAHGTDDSIGARATQLIASCPEGLQEIVLQKYIMKNHETLVATRLPWFIPEQFGGVGLPNVGRFSCDDKSLRCLRMISERRAKPPKPCKHTLWNTWKASGRALDRAHPGSLNRSSPTDESVRFSEYSNAQALANMYEGDGGSSLLSDSDLMGKFCIDLLFRVPITTLLADTVQNGDNVVLVTEKLARDRYLRRLREFWKSLYKTTRWPEPLRSVSDAVPDFDLVGEQGKYIPITLLPRQPNILKYSPDFTSEHVRSGEWIVGLPLIMKRAWLSGVITSDEYCSWKYQ